MTMPIKDITDTLSTISAYYKSHVGIDLDMEMSIDNDDVMAIDYAIKALEELQAHREAWMKVVTEIKEYQKDAFYYDDVAIKRKQILEVINKYKPKEGDAE